MARIFMTGGTGFISSRVARRLAERGHEVHIFHRGETSAELPGDIRHHYGDRTMPGELSAAMDIVHPEIFVDMNPYTHEEAARAASAAEQVDVDAAIVISSGDVYRQCDGLRGRWEGPPDPVPLSEDAPLRETRFPFREIAEPHQHRLYDYDKIHVEEAFLEAESPATILRLPKIFGPDDLSCFSDYLEPMEKRLPVLRIEPARAAWRWARAEVGACADASVETVEKPRRGVFNLAPEQCPTELDWIHMLGEAIGWEGKVRELSDGQRGEDVFDWKYDFALDGARFRELWDTRLLTNPQAALSRATQELTRRERPVPPPIRTRDRVARR